MFMFLFALVNIFLIKASDGYSGKSLSRSLSTSSIVSVGSIDINNIDDQDAGFFNHNAFFTHIEGSVEGGELIGAHFLPSLSSSDKSIIIDNTVFGIDSFETDVDNVKRVKFVAQDRSIKDSIKTIFPENITKAMILKLVHGARKALKFINA